MSSALGFSVTERTARKPHRCYDCGVPINVGDRYKEVVASPRYDFNPRPGQWTRGAFCIKEAPGG
jgi:hypothetical protein